MNFLVNNLDKQLQEYEEKDIILQTVLGLDTDTLIDIAKSQSLYIAINGERIPLYLIATAMKTTGLSYNELYRNFLAQPFDGKMISDQLSETIKKIKYRDEIQDMIDYYKKHPCKYVDFVEDIIGIKLYWYQKVFLKAMTLVDKR